jgi:hypothetical protein
MGATEAPNEQKVRLIRRQHTLELVEHVYGLKCESCGRGKKRVWGFVCEDGDARANYYAL